MFTPDLIHVINQIDNLQFFANVHFVYAPEDKTNRLEFKTSLTMKLQSEKTVKCITKVLTRTSLTVFITINILVLYKFCTSVLYHTCVDSTTILLAALLNT